MLISDHSNVDENCAFELRSNNEASNDTRTIDNDSADKPVRDLGAQSVPAVHRESHQRQAPIHLNDYGTTDDFEIMRECDI